MNLRVGFTGASGTGKTTLAKWVSEEFGLPLNPVTTRSVAADMGFANPYDVDAAGRRGEYQHRLIGEKMAWEAAHDSFVADRTLADNLAYTMLHDVRAIDDSVLDAVANGMQRYTHVFFFPVESFCAPGNDPVRVKEMAYHRAYQMVLNGVLIYNGTDRIFALDLFKVVCDRQRYIRYVLTEGQGRDNDG